MKRYRKPKAPRHLSRKTLTFRLAQAFQKLEATHASLNESRLKERKSELRQQTLEDKVVELQKKVDAYYAPVLGLRNVRMTAPDTQMMEQWYISGGFSIGFQVDIQHIRLMPQACGRDAYLEGLADQFARRAYQAAMEKLQIAVR